MALRLFILEFRRALFPFMIFVVGVAGACLLAEQVYQHFQKTPSTVHEAVNLLIVIAIAIYGFPCGSRAFSGEFKETHYLFIQSLPLARERAWLALVLANLSTSLISIIVLIALRPSVLTSLPEGYVPQTALSWALIVYFILFCTGCCFSLLFRKVVLNYLAGFFVCAIVLFEIALELTYRNFSSEFYYDGGGGGLDLPLMGASWLLVCLAFLTLSMRFFALGEFNMGKVQLRNSSRIVTSLALLFVLIAICEGSGLFAVFDRWTTGNWWQSHRAEVSVDGKYLLVREMRWRHPYIVRRNIIDVPTGNAAARIEEIGPSMARWSQRDDSLNVIVAVESPLLRLGYALPVSTRLLVLSPEGKELRTHWLWFSRIVASAQMDDGQTLLVAMKGDEGKILEYDSRSGEIRELTSGVLVDDARSSRVPEGYLVAFENKSEPSRVWLVGQEVKELRWAPSKTKQSGIRCVIQSTAYSELDVCKSELARLFPFNTKTGSLVKPARHGFYLLRDEALAGERWGVEYSTPSSTVLYMDTDADIRSGNLFAFSQRRQSWRLLAENNPLNSGAANAARNPYFLWPGGLDALDSSEGLAAYTVEKGAVIQSYLYDANLDRVFELGTLPKPSPPVQPLLTMRRYRGMKGLAVFFGEGDYPGYTGDFYLYVPGSGALQKLSHPVNSSPSKVLYMDDEGNLIYERDDTISVSVRYLRSDGTERQLWPLNQ